MHPLVAELHSEFTAHANPEQAVPMANYLRNQFAFFGIPMPLNAELQRKVYARVGLPPLDALAEVVCQLWELPEREFQYAGLSLLARFEKDLSADFLPTLEHLLLSKSWWDTVDGLASGSVGSLFRRIPSARAEGLARWRNSECFWLRRTCLLFQLSYTHHTDFPLLCDLIRENLDSKEFFIQKAIGWALRAYSRVDEAAVRTFVAETPLAPLSAHEALRWLEQRSKS